MTDIKWGGAPSQEDIAKAKAFLELLAFGWTGHTNNLLVPAKDLLRASGNLGLILPRDNAGVKKYLDRFKKSETIDRVLIVQGTRQFPLIIAEGYHRVCAAWHTEEATPVACTMELI